MSMHGSSDNGYIKSDNTKKNNLFSEWKEHVVNGIHNTLDSIDTYITENPKKVKNGLKTLGIVVLAGGMAWYGSRLGRGNAIEEIEHLQQSTEIENPYRAFGPNSMVSNQPAKGHFLKMKEGQQFWYQGKIVTLIERLDDETKGYTDIFLVGNKIIEVPTSGLSKESTIDNVFDKYDKTRK